MINKDKNTPLYCVRFTSRINFPIFLYAPKGFVSLQNFCWNFSQNFMFHLWMGKIFKVIKFKLLENVFASQKIKSTYFHLCPPGKKSDPKFLSSSTWQKGNYSFPPQAAFFFKPISPARRKGSKGTILVLITGYYLNRVLWWWRRPTSKFLKKTI